MVGPLTTTLLQIYSYLLLSLLSTNLKKIGQHLFWQRYMLMGNEVGASSSIYRVCAAALSS